MIGVLIRYKGWKLAVSLICAHMTAKHAKGPSTPSYLLTNSVIPKKILGVLGFLASTRPEGRIVQIGGLATLAETTNFL